MSLGLLIVAISALISAAAVSYWMLLIGLILQGAGSAVYFTSSYLAVSRLCPASKRGRHLGLFVSLQFLGYALFALISLAMVHLGVEPSLVEGTEGRLEIRQLTRSLRNRSLASINLGLLAISVVRIGLIATILPVFAVRNLSMTPVEFGAVLTAFSFTNFITLLPAGTFSDRLGRRPFMFASLFITGILALSLALVGNEVTFTILMIAMGAALGLTGPIGAWVSDVSRPSELGASMGLFRTMGDVGSFIGPIALTFFLPPGEEVIGAAPFVLAGIIAIASSVPLLWARDPAAERARASVKQ